MNSVLSTKSRIKHPIVLQALAMVAILIVIMPLVFRYQYGVHMPVWFWAASALFNFLFFVALLSFMRWLQAKREHWGTRTKRWFGTIMLLLGVALFVAAFYIHASR